MNNRKTGNPNSQTKDDGPPLKVRRSNAEAASASSSQDSASTKASDSNQSSAIAKTSADAQPATVPKSAGIKPDSLAENLTCSICQSLFHDCVSVQPCLHSFCSGCLSEWLAQSDACPDCRKTVECVSRNHILGNCVASLTAQRPEMARTASDIRDLDAKNKIPKADLLKLDDKTKRMLANRDHNEEQEDADEEEDDDDEEEEEEDDDDEEEEENEEYNDGETVDPYNNQPGGFTMRCRQCPAAANALTLTVPQNTPVYSTRPPPGSDCRVYVFDGQNRGSTNYQQGASNSNAASDYICSAEQVHILCECCRQPLPNRARRGIPMWLIPPQRCAVCERVYCHAYWGCRRAGAPCYGCLALLRDWRVTELHTRTYLLGNEHESTLLNTYLASKSLSMGEMFRQCLMKLESGTWTVPQEVFAHVPAGVGSRAVQSNTPLCRQCALCVFDNLVLQFRYSLPQHDRNAHFNESKRNTCWYGTECRTQTHNKTHAQTYNHVCRRTK